MLNLRFVFHGQGASLARFPCLIRLDSLFWKFDWKLNVSRQLLKCRIQTWLETYFKIQIGWCEDLPAQKYYGFPMMQRGKTVKNELV